MNFITVADWYVIFVKTFEEIRFAERLQLKLNNIAKFSRKAAENGSVEIPSAIKSQYVIFIPTKERTFRKGTEITLHKIITFPGYVFVATLEDFEKAFETLRPLIFKDKSAFKLLGDNGDIRCAKISDKEKEFLSKFMNREFNTPAVEVIETEENVYIIHDALIGIEARVKKVNKYRQTVDVEFEMFGGKQVVTFAMTLVRRHNNEPSNVQSDAQKNDAAEALLV